MILEVECLQQFPLFGDLLGRCPFGWQAVQVPTYKLDIITARPHRADVFEVLRPPCKHLHGDEVDAADGEHAELAPIPDQDAPYLSAVRKRISTELHIAVQPGLGKTQFSGDLGCGMLDGAHCVFGHRRHHIAVNGCSQRWQQPSQHARSTANEQQLDLGVVREALSQP